MVLIIRINELRQREVINILDGKRLGTIKDVDLDLEEGKIKSLILPGQKEKTFFFFGRSEDLIIPWEKVIRVGVDVILVESPGFTNISAGDKK